MSQTARVGKVWPGRVCAYALIILLVPVLTAACRPAENRLSRIRNDIERFVADKDADIGVAVIVDGVDTLSVNGDCRYPMMSVYKFPIAMAVAEKCRVRGLSFSDSVLVDPGIIVADTYSPMLERYPSMLSESVVMTLDTLLVYAMQHSDNNASDILLDWVDSPAVVDEYIKWMGHDDMDVVWSEAEMYEDNTRSYDNSTTPLEMARLIDAFDTQFDDSLSMRLKSIMESCSTGADRLAAPLAGAGAVVGHKTGTGFTLPDGRLMALNDVGYVHLADGTHYSMAVFVARSGYSQAETAAIIAGISQMVYDAIVKIPN